MEANLNQFRLFTVRAEHEVNDRRGGNSGRQTSTYRRQNPGCAEGGQTDAVDLDNDGPTGEAEDGSDSGENSIQQEPWCLDDRPAENGQLSDEEVGDDLQGRFDGTRHAEKSLVEALVSLEHTINQHCQLLNKKLRRERGVLKNSMSETARTPMITSAVPKAAIRADKTNPCFPSVFSGRHLHNKVIVYIRVVFLKIGEIDTLKENFMADAFIQARWREPALDGKASQFQLLQNVEDIEWEKYWNPKLYVENNLGEPKETVWQTLNFNARGDATVYERRRIKGCFLENLELDEFPFDTQDLTLTISTERSETELELEEDSSEISSINVQSFVDEQEWKLHSHVETWKRITTRIYQNSKFKHPAFSTSCRASRRPGFFIWNIFLVMLFICSLTFSTFSVELTKPENRLQLSFILLLTTITFKFVVSQTLPRISYLTYLDKYILTSMGILCGVCVWHAIIPLFKYDLELAKTIDRWGLIVSGSSYFLFHICFFLYIYFVALHKRWKYDQKDRDHKERVKKLQRLQEMATATDTAAAAASAIV